MANGNQPSYEEYKNYSTDEKNIFQFTAFRAMHDFPKKYAKKWVEKWVITVMSVVGLSVLAAVVGTVVIAGG